ncbi:efflux RND transporter periplasmic adaptor subunit [Gellertiella hungarica]|uniref:RND family efflux transporter MFP subunit n=1 Tax=Gellertiella hungarica TaxID=1572859 RepID=A0A7W6J2H6_9HYPH|nr:efflux RND transporter periplasmic adaptor subunit [Gellertiella hungarica]MBB4063581.1 RND family efflux transporter MFP subunit [Gellertiella hungarica]
MRIAKQLALSLAVLVVGGAVAVWYTPEGAALLARASGKPAAGQGEGAAAGRGQGAGGQGQGQGRRADGPPLVVVAAVTEGVANARLDAIGTGQALNSVTVMPQGSGVVTRLDVKPGDKVKAGQLLGQLDNQAELLARDKAAVTLKGSLETKKTYEGSNASITRLQQFTAGVTAEEAQLELNIAETNLKRRDILAPADGVAGIVQVSMGAYVTPSTPIVVIDDRSSLLVDFYVPEHFVSFLKPGMALEARTIAFPGEVFKGEIAALDNQMDAVSRTIRVRARIDNGDDRLRGGMSFTVTLRFEGERYPAVDPLAVQWDGEGAYVWRLGEGDKAEKVRGSVVQRDADRVLFKADIKPGDRLVTEGVQRLRPGMAVRVDNGGAGA